MTDRQVFACSLNQLGLSAWFRGSVMGAIGLNDAGVAKGFTGRLNQLVGTR